MRIGDPGPDGVAACNRGCTGVMPAPFVTQPGSRTA